MVVNINNNLYFQMVRWFQMVMRWKVDRSEEVKKGQMRDRVKCLTEVQEDTADRGEVSRRG